MALNLNLNALSQSAQTSANLEFIDLSPAPAKAKIVRQGFDVPAVTVDQKKIDQFLGSLILVPTTDLPRVVSQSVPSGTKVTKGTVVDLVLAPRTKIPFSIFDGAHLSLQAKTLDALDPLFSDAAAKKTLLTYSTAAEIQAAEKTHLITALTGAGVQVDDANAGTSLEAALNTARGALAYFG
jgi:hypothetical protein